LQTLAGHDVETRSEVGFRTILVKMQYSDSLKKWNYVIKNLIILDRCIDEKYFLNDISELDFPHIKNYKDDDPSICKSINQLNSYFLLANIQIDGLIQKYYFLIVEKAKIYKNKGNVFNVDKTQNQLPLYLKACHLDKLLLEVSQIQYLNSLIFEVKTN